MANDNIKLGYCPSCHQNIDHFRGENSSSTSIGKKLTSGFWRIGPWLCGRCERVSYFLQFPRYTRPTNNFALNPTVESSDESIGNFIRNDNSLVLQQKRSSRFSQKFRDGVVQRITTGKASIGQLCVELKVTESDLVTWIGDLLQRRQDRVDELTMILESHAGTKTDVSRVADDSKTVFEGPDLIEGSYQQHHKS